MKPKYGIVGCGSISRFHLQGLEKVGAEVVHVSDINEEAAAPILRKSGASFSRDYNKLIEDPAVTAVSILTSSRFHRDIAVKALRSGKDVICEKTMTTNADDSEEVVRAARDSGKIFFTAFMKRFFPAAQKARELLPSLGRIFSSQARAYQCWGDLYRESSGEGLELVLKNQGGAITKCAGSHMIDMMLYLLGRPRSLYASIDYIPGTRVDRKAAAIFEYPRAGTVFFETAAHPLKRIGRCRDSWDEFLQINGTGGRLELFTVLWDCPENNPALLVHYDNDNETSTEYRFPPVNPFDIEIEYFNKCLINRTQGSPDVIDGFNVDVIIETMEKSAESKRSLEIEWRGL